MKYKILLTIGIIIILFILVKKPIENFVNSPTTQLQSQAVAVSNSVISGKTSVSDLSNLERTAIGNAGDALTNNLALIMNPLKNSSYTAGDQNSQNKTHDMMSGILAVPTFTNDGNNKGVLTPVTKQNTPVNLVGGESDHINRCESITNSDCGNFDNADFAANCGICYEPGQTSDTSKDPRIGGLYFSPSDRSILQSKLNDPTLSQRAKNDLLKGAEPSIGKCNKFAVTKDRCIRLQKEQACEKSQSFSADGSCGQCLDTGKFSYIDIQDAGVLSPRLLVTGSGFLKKDGKNIAQLTESPQQIDLTENNEGDVIILQVTGDGGNIPYIAGFLAGDTQRSANGFSQDIYRLIDYDRTSGSKPKASGRINIFGESCIKIVPGIKPINTDYGFFNIFNRNNRLLTMELQLNLVYTFLGTDTIETEVCPTSPYLLLESSANKLSAGTCYKAGNGPGSYSQDCLQEIWAQAGCTANGSDYPSNVNSGGKLNTIGKLQNISEYIYELAIKAITGKTLSGQTLNLLDRADAAKRCTGRIITNPCDVLNPGEPISKDCLRFLYLDPKTYSAPASQKTKNVDGKDVYCTDAGFLNPANPQQRETPIFTNLPNAPTNIGRYEIKKNYKINFIINIRSTIDNWGSIFHFTSTGGNYGTVGNRMPAVWLYPGRTSMHVIVGDEKDANFGIMNTNSSIPIGIDTPIEIKVEKDIISVTVGTTTQTMKQLSSRPTGSAILYAPDPWYPRMNGTLKNFTLVTSDGPLPSSISEYVVNPSMSIDQIKGKFNKAHIDMSNPSATAAQQGAAFQACRGIAVGNTILTAPSSGTKGLNYKGSM